MWIGVGWLGVCAAEGRSIQDPIPHRHGAPLIFGEDDNCRTVLGKPTGVCWARTFRCQGGGAYRAVVIDERD